ncbi:MAG: RHS repeat-associated core domain-containing protein, partial [Dysgonomonas sp.]
YVGNVIYENNTLKRILVDGGYYESGNYYFYINDHLGNNRVVADAAASVVQSTQYYPFGTSFADAITTSTQPYKYNGNELDQMHGLPSISFSVKNIGSFDLPFLFLNNKYGLVPLNNPLFIAS